ncbi:MAG: formate/nitrite transporter family protein [Lachnospiraceae bacterium]|nr:formate/nitrite transporter family protein [Lachnospiraceae bacterium]
MYSPAEIAERYKEAGANKTRLPVAKMFVLALFAGIFIAFGAFGSQVAGASIDSASLGKFLSALVFPVGLMMVLMAGAELFTGNSLLVIPVLAKEATVKGMLKNWVVVYIGNLLGSILIALLLTYSHSFNLFDKAVAVSVVNTAASKVSLSFSDAFLRGILCNVLVCISVWISFSAKEAAGKIIGLFLPIMLFVISGYEHCVANMYFIPAGILASHEYGLEVDGLTWGSFFVNNLLPVTLGNVVGGACIVGMGYFFVYLSKDK